MSKCDFVVEFERSDRVYTSGDTVKGIVRIRVNQDVHCRGLRIAGLWKTHGRGNRASADYFSTNVYQGALVAGQQYEFAFEFEAANSPWTYHGEHLNIDHYVSVRIDVPWAFDPKYETEFVVEPGPTSTIPQPAMQETGSGTKQTGKILSTIIGLVFIAVGIPLLPIFGFGLILIGIGGVVLFFVYRNVLAERKIGHVEFQLDPNTVAPGGWVDVHLSFLPRSTGTLNRVVVTLLGQEVVVSGSGTNRTTHTHKLHQEEQIGLQEMKFSAGEAVRMSQRVQLPDLPAYSTDLVDNKLTWTVTARLDIPHWPDWLDSRELILAPAVCLAARPTDSRGTRPKPDHQPAPPMPERSTEIPPLVAQPASPEPVADLSLEPDPWLTSEPEIAEVVHPTAPANEVAAGENMEALLSLAQALAQADRFGSERQQMIDATQGQVYRAEISVERTSYTYGVFDEAEYRSGQTISGTLLGCDQRVSIQLPESENDQVANIRHGDHCRVEGRVVKWDDLYNRLELRGRSLS